ncbi:MAG: GTPase domain-containing protein [Alphaproteobacteria bacterium]|nr:GTPase domain-containing protein [Alphaproteobacteria bacterium]
MRVNSRKRELSLKVVYYGPGLSGKTTNLQHLHRRCPDARRGQLVTLDTASERTLFFDYFPFSYGQVGGYRVKLDLFTVPGQSFYHQTRRAVLHGVDGLVFVADSAGHREEANILAREDLEASLRLEGRELSRLPQVWQWNKRDVRNALPLSTLERQLNPGGAPSVEAIAALGKGVWETHQLVVRLLLERLRAQAGSAADVPEAVPAPDVQAKAHA